VCFPSLPVSPLVSDKCTNDETDGETNESKGPSNGTTCPGLSSLDGNLRDSNTTTSDSMTGSNISSCSDEDLPCLNISINRPRCDITEFNVDENAKPQSSNINVGNIVGIFMNLPNLIFHDVTVVSRIVYSLVCNNIFLDSQ
jgi:hypothetical protein